MAAQGRNPRNIIPEASSLVSKSNGFLTVNSAPFPNPTNEPLLFSTKPVRDPGLNQAGFGRGSKDLAEPPNGYLGGRDSEVSEGSSIDHDAPPGKNKAVVRTRIGQHTYSAESVMNSTISVPQSQLWLPETGIPDRLGPESLIPPPLKDLINTWCAAKGDEYNVSRIPCLTKNDPKTTTQSSRGRPANWQKPDGNPLTAVMYALTGEDTRNGRPKILVVEGERDMLGPFIVAYVSEKSTHDRVAYKQWIGLRGDTNGFGEGISAYKVLAPQTQASHGKRMEVLQRHVSGESDEVVVTSDLLQNTLGPQKRKRTSGSHLGRGHFETKSDNELGGDENGKGVASAPALKTKGDKSRRRTSRARQTQTVPMVIVPSRSTDFGDHKWQSLETSSSPSSAESYQKTRFAEPRASDRKSSPVQRVAKPDVNKIIDLTDSSRELPPSLKSERATSANQIDLTSHSPPSTTTVQGLLTQPMTSNNVMTSKTADTGTTDKPISHMKLVQNPASGGPLLSYREYVNKRTASILVSSNKQAVNTETSQRVDTSDTEVDGSVERRTAKNTDNAVTPSVEAPKSGQIPGPALLLLDTQSSTENTTTASSVARPPGKSKKQLKLQQVFVKFNSALAHEPPRVRPFTACDTVQKLFNQARTGDVFGKASDVSSGGKLLTVEFRGSERLPTEVYIVNEDDEEDFSDMKRALLKKDWWIEIEYGDSTSNTIQGGGLLDVRNAK